VTQSTKEKRTEAERQTYRLRRYSANMEDYLEAILTLSSGGLPVTVTQLSDALRVSKPSVTAAMSKLAAESLVRHEKYGAVELTSRGRTIAEDVSHRHEALRLFLSEILGMRPETADEDACKLEHHLSHDSSVQLTRFVDYVLNADGGKPAWLSEFVSSQGNEPVRQE